MSWRCDSVIDGVAGIGSSDSIPLTKLAVGFCLSGHFLIYLKIGQSAT